MNKYNYFDIKDLLGNHNIIGDIINVNFSTIDNIHTKNQDALCFIDKDRTDRENLINNCKAKTIVIDPKKLEQEYPNRVFIQVANPKVVFSKIGNLLFVKKDIPTGIHKSSVIHPDAKIHKNVTIGPNCTIGKVSIDSGSIIYPNVVLYDNVEIGKNVIINSGSIIGSDGFGYNIDDTKELIQFPHLGNVILEDDVHIGSNVCIDKGALSSTVIGMGSKIDNLVHVAHNVKIGRNSSIVANSVICGSTIIGDRTYVAPSSCVRDAIKVGDDVIVGLSSNVLKSIPDKEVWLGSPAKKFKNN